MAGGQEVARLIVSVGADLSGLERGLGEAKAQTETFGTGMGKAATAVRQVETAAISQAAAVRQSGEAHREAHGHVQRFNLETATTAELMVGSRRTFMQLTESLVGLGAGAVAAGVAFGVFEKVKGAIETTEQLGHQTLVLQSIMGGSSEDASKLLATFDRFGLSSEQAGVMLGIFSRHLQGVDDPMDGVGIGAKSSAQALAQLGVSATDAEGHLRPTSDIILDVADGFSHMQDGAEKTSIAMALFGRSGRDIIFPLNQGRQGLQEAMEAAQKYGLVLSGENVEQIHAFMMAQKDLQQASTGLALAVGETLVPALTAGETALADLLNNVRLGNSDILTFASGIGLAAEAVNALKMALAGLPHASMPGAQAAGLLMPAGFENVAGGALAGAPAPLDLYQYALQSNAQQAMLAATPGGYDIAPFLRGQNPALVGGASPGVFAGSFAPGTFSGPGGVTAKETASRAGEESATAYLQGQALAQEATSDLFARHAGPGTNLAKALAPTDADIAAEADQLAKAWETYHREADRITKENERVEKEEKARAEREKKRQADEAARRAELSFSQGQAAARMGVSNLGLWEQISGMREPAADKAAQEREIQRIEHERMLAQIDLTQAQHAGDEAAATRIKERIGLLDAEIARVRALGIAHKADAVGASSVFDPRALGRHTTDDPYHLYGPGSATNPETNLPALPPRPQVDLSDTETHAKLDGVIAAVNDQGGAMADGLVALATSMADGGDPLAALGSAIKRLRHSGPAQRAA